MKALQTLIFVAILFIATTISAQTKLPFKGSLKPLMTTDSLTHSEIQSKLNTNPSRSKTQELPRLNNSQPSHGRIPANPKDYMNYTDLNGNPLYKPKSSLSLMIY